jgi:hypothetical protein
MSLITLSTMVVSKVLYPELILNTITSVSSVSGKLINSVYYLSNLSHKDIELQELLLKSDIIQDILIIKCFIEEKQHSNINSQTIFNCINNLNETLFELEENINSVTQKIELHKTLWFNYFRTYDISKEKVQIPFLIEKLKHRFNILIKISSIL